MHNGHVYFGPGLARSGVVFFLFFQLILFCFGGRSVAGPSTLTVAISSPVVTFDPADYRDRTTQVVLKNIFSSLTTWDKDMTIVPQLAESWRLIDDMTWEFRLKRGICFHNGQELTARDVQFSLERIITPGAIAGRTSPRKGLLESLKKVTIIDDYTLHLQTETKWASLPQMLCLQEIVPYQYIKEHGLEYFLKHPIGTGPFSFISEEHGRQIILERFSLYFEGKPDGLGSGELFSRIVFQCIPSKTDQISLIQKGSCDLLCNVPTWAVPILARNPGVHILKKGATISYFADIRCKRNPFTAREVRKALNYAVDISELVDHLFDGQGITLPTLVLPNSFGYHPTLPAYPYDPQKAKQLLLENYPVGRPLVIASVTDNMLFANRLAAYFNKVGLKTRVKTLTTDKSYDDVVKADWDILVTSWGNATLDPSGILKPKVHSQGPGNYSGYGNAEVDSLLVQAEREFLPEKRKKLYYRIQEIISDEAPFIFGYAPAEFYVFREHIHNVSPLPSGFIAFHTIWFHPSQDN